MPSRHFLFTPLRTALSLACLSGLLAAPAHAVVSLPNGDELLNGDINFAYGSDGMGYSSQFLYIEELKSSLSSFEQVFTIPDLTYDYALSGVGTNLLVIDYRIGNINPSKTWTDLSFRFTTQADGEQLNYLDSVAETWGAQQTGDPGKRVTVDLLTNLQKDAISYMQNPSLNNFPALEGMAPPANCLAPSTCDADVGLQWDIAALAPGEVFNIRVGFSDNGQTLSSRYLTVTSADGSSVLTLSGTASIVPVPEPSSWALIGAGLGAIGWLGRRKRI